MQRIELSRRQELMIAERNKKKNQAQQERLKREKREKAQAEAEERRKREEIRKKKIVSLSVLATAIVAVILVVVFILSAQADFNARSGLNLQLSPTKDYYVVTQLDEEEANKLQSVVIPSEYKGLPVKEISTSAFSNCKNLTSVEIPNSVTSIGEYAFSNCWRLLSITIPDSVTSIGDFTFYNCSSLTSITIPNSVTSIGNSAFSYCNSLKSVYYKGTANGWAKISIDSFGNSDLTSATRYYYSENEPTESGEYWRYDTNGEIETCHVHAYNALKFNSENHWYECSCGGKNNLDPHFGGTATYTEKAICEVCAQPYGDYVVEPFTEGLRFSLQNDNSYAVTDYTGTATEVKIPSTYKGLYVTSIGKSAFSICSSLTSVTIPDSVTSIGEYAFYGCSSLTSITLPFVGASKDGTSNTHFGYIFGANSSSYNDDYVPTSLKKVIITSATSIGEDAFYNCSSLTSVTIPGSVTSIGNSAFSGCSSLTSITIPESVTSIGNAAFYRCSSLTSVVIPDSVTSIGDYAFRYCTSLTSVEIGDSVNSIGFAAFGDCSSLTSVTFKDTDTWYITTYDSYTGGLQASVTDPSNNATCFKSIHCGEYWYKK